MGYLCEIRAQSCFHHSLLLSVPQLPTHARRALRLTARNSLNTFSAAFVLRPNVYRQTVADMYSQYQVVPRASDASMGF